MAFLIDPKVALFYDVTFILGSVVYCRRCGAEATYRSNHPEFTNENHYD